mmetsp:Transcript_31559/g.74421  ORF Transcript_31559/g.74421 Transcript_31559/m.74421 type:complete len:241 (+) Transcript_31559:211-933(+)
MRKLWSKPLLAADWHDEYEEKAASWWELFVDLLLVVTCSTVAEALEEDATSDGFIAFVTTFTLFFQGWNLYAQFCSRFIDNSLLHSFQLFLYLLATSSMVTNANGFEYSEHFALSALLQRCSLLLMYFTAGLQVPRALVPVDDDRLELRGHPPLPHRRAIRVPHNQQDVPHPHSLVGRFRDVRGCGCAVEPQVTTPILFEAPKASSSSLVLTSVCCPEAPLTEFRSISTTSQREWGSTPR